MFQSEAERQEYLRSAEVYLEEGRDKVPDMVAVVGRHTGLVLAWVPFDDMKAIVANWVRRTRNAMDDESVLLDR